MNIGALTLDLLLFGLREAYIRGRGGELFIINEAIELFNRLCPYSKIQAFRFLSCVSSGVENMVGTASSRSFTHFPVLSIY